MQSPFRQFGGLAIRLVLLATTVSAQLDTGTITVSVKDSSGSAVPGANVTLRKREYGRGGSLGNDERSGESECRADSERQLFPARRDERI